MLLSLPDADTEYAALQVSLSREGSFVPKPWQIYLLFIGLLIIHGTLNVRSPFSFSSDADAQVLMYPSLARSRSAPRSCRA